MKLKISKRVKQLTPSATFAMAAKAKALKAAGHDVISFAMGEPDFDTPQLIKDAAKQSIEQGFTKYTQTGGIPELKNAICEKLKRENNLEYKQEQVVVSCGAYQSIYNALQALFDDGEEVIIPAPYWVSYPDQVKLCGGIPKIVATEAKDGFCLSAAAFKNAITQNTRALILCSPSNPTGNAYSKEKLQALAKIAVEHNIAVISDEIYEKLIYDDFTHHSFASLSDEAKAITITINGVSKAFSMTGWRMGYAAGPAEVIAKIQALQSQQTSSITSFVQQACIVALNEGQHEVEKMRKTFEQRRNLMHKLLNEIPKLHCAKPEGAFYLFPDVSAYLQKTAPKLFIDDSNDLAEYLLTNAHIATVSGDAFGAPGYLRFSYAASETQIRTGVERLKDSLLQLS